MPEREIFETSAEEKAKGDAIRDTSESARHVSQVGSANPQKESLLMRLPQELRNKIYAHLFSSTRFMSGEIAMPVGANKRLVSAPHGLAFLRSCRQVYTEIGNTWLSQVLFCFESPVAMLDKFTKISLDIRSMIRNVQVSGKLLSIICDREYFSYHTSQSFKLLPGLKLDRLTVLGTLDPKESYSALDFLIKYGDGWKELHYISHASTFIAHKRTWFSLDEELLDKQWCFPVLQPTTWQRHLEIRDGSDSGASVIIYRSTNPHSRGSVMHAATRVKFIQTLCPGQDGEYFNEEEGSQIQIMAPGEREKEMLVVVKRGRGADYEEKQASPYHAHGDIRSDLPTMTWKEIKWEQDFEAAMQRSHLLQLLGYDDDGEEETEYETLVDEYSHVDDYVWPHYYLLYK
jgi:hypothetical protein